MGIFVLRVVCDSDLSVIVNLKYIEIVGWYCDSREGIIGLVNWQRKNLQDKRKSIKFWNTEKTTHYN